MAVIAGRRPSLTVCLCILFFICSLVVLHSRRGSFSSYSYGVLSPSPDGRSADRSKIGKLSMLYGDNPVYQTAMKTHEQHNMDHGYRMDILKKQILDKYWSKPAYILRRLLEELSKPEDEMLQWLVWFDADILIMNPHIPLEIFLPPTPDYSHVNLLVTDDHRGLNNGVFFIRVNQWSIWLLTAILGYVESSCRPPGKLRTADQGAMENIMSEVRFRNGTMHVPQRWFNAFTGVRDETLSVSVKAKENSVREGDLLVHFAGHPDERRETMGRWIWQREQRRGAWAVPLEKTGYLEEIRTFWEGEARREGERYEVKKKEAGRKQEPPKSS